VPSGGEDLGFDYMPNGEVLRPREVKFELEKTSGHKHLGTPIFASIISSNQHPDSEANIYPEEKNTCVLTI
jgi:hypothetical protein